MLKITLENEYRVVSVLGKQESISERDAFTLFSDAVAGMGYGSFFTEKKEV